MAHVISDPSYVKLFAPCDVVCGGAVNTAEMACRYLGAACAGPHSGGVSGGPEVQGSCGAVRGPKVELGVEVSAKGDADDDAVTVQGSGVGRPGRAGGCES